MNKWKLVPVEPTPEMDNAARDWSVSKYGRGIGNDAAHGCYSAMLEAAPPAPSVPDGWKLVPYTPTEEMLEQAAYAVNSRPKPSKYEATATPAIIFWTAMLKYSPESTGIKEPPAKLNAMLDEHRGEIAGLKTRLAEAEAINSIDARFCGRLALILECVVLDPHGHFDLACQLLEEYKAEWEKVNPSPPTFMGEPMRHHSEQAMNQLLEALK